ncbi:MAG: type II toxin-antitoxin system HicB family antitoxin [Treponema sp.]|jgi:predicted RNase H-like HicB family nuclease|nr:type II toxin-antitoxin system HicB family antitoxin [Treponema sp.]
MKLTYPAIFYKDNADGCYAVEVPDLPGCVSGGSSLAEAILMAADAASGWILSELEDGNSLPPTSDIEDIHPEEGGFVNFLALDMDAYIEKYGKSALIRSAA